MGFKMNCDRCGRFMRNISMGELKKQTDFGKEIICTPCKNWELRSRSAVEKAVDRMNGRLEKYRTTFLAEIRKICEESREDPELVPEGTPDLPPKQMAPAKKKKK
jgi:ssDNA-binding Zn-finger/Zn-ribbon topoisomerase 1